MDESLMDKTRRLLRERMERDSLPVIHAELHAKGSEISFYWLRKFSAGGVKDPSVNRIEELYEYLSGTKLAV